MSGLTDQLSEMLWGSTPATTTQNDPNWGLIAGIGAAVTVLYVASYTCLQPFLSSTVFGREPRRPRYS